jgi:acyl-CoA synthetase (AMP-forming)/AMP-acid ligase II/thioesterase domain-containing protein
MNRGLPFDCVATEPSTICDAIRLHAALDPQRPAIVCTDLPALTFGELDRTIRQIGDDLKAAGLSAASRVGIVLPNGPEAAVVAIAVCAHAVCFPLSAALSESEFEFELTRARLDAIVVPAWVDVPAMGPAKARDLSIFRVPKATSSLADIYLEKIAGAPAAQRQSAEPSSQSVSIIQMSSGSTGTPKLILVTHANLFDIAEKVRMWFGLTPSDRCACLLPTYSGFGFKVALVAPLLVGSGVALHKRQRPEDVAMWCTDLQPTWFVAIPPFLNAALDKLRSTPDLRLDHSLRFFASGTTYLPEPVRTGLEEILGVPGLEFYGLREAGVVAANPAPPARAKPSSVGLITPDVAILDDDNRVLPRGSEGAVAVRGQGISPGYVEALPPGSDTVPGNAKDKWKLTGDLGVIDSEGFLSIIGRTKDIINRGGEKIAPSEIERALSLHPAVHEAVAFSVPHPRLGESIAAAVVLKTETEATSAELQSFLFDRVASAKIPQHIYIVATLPRTRTGKVQISELKDHFSDRANEIHPPTGNLEVLILEIWERLLGRSDFGVDDNFFELGGDSLLATTTLLEVEALTRRPISQSALRAVWTVRQLAATVLRDIPPENELVTRAKDGRGQPFFFCHGDYRDRGIYALKLTSLITEDVPIFLLNHYRGFRDAGRIGLEEVASLYVPHVLAAQPSGPVRVGGYCIGGLLAWEIARQLKKAGRDIEWVVLIESPSLNGRKPLRAAKTALRLASHLSPKRVGEKIELYGMWAIWVWARSRPVALGVMRKLLRYASPDSPYKSAHFPLRRDEYRRVVNYIPENLDTDVYCFVCDKNAARIDYEPSSWRPLARTVHDKQVPGDHNTCVTTFAGVVANELQKIISSRDSKPRMQ